MINGEICLAIEDCNKPEISFGILLFLKQTPLQFFRP